MQNIDDPPGVVSVDVPADAPDDIAEVMIACDMLDGLLKAYPEVVGVVGFEFVPVVGPEQDAEVKELAATITRGVEQLGLPVDCTRLTALTYPAPDLFNRVDMALARMTDGAVLEDVRRARALLAQIHQRAAARVGGTVELRTAAATVLDGIDRNLAWAQTHPDDAKVYYEGYWIEFPSMYTVGGVPQVPLPPGASMVGLTELRWPPVHEKTMRSAVGAWAVIALGRGCVIAEQVESVRLFRPGLEALRVKDCEVHWWLERLAGIAGEARRVVSGSRDTGPRPEAAQQLPVQEIVDAVADKVAAVVLPAKDEADTIRIGELRRRWDECKGDPQTLLRSLAQVSVAPRKEVAVRLGWSETHVRTMVAKLRAARFVRHKGKMEPNDDGKEAVQRFKSGG